MNGRGASCPFCQRLRARVRRLQLRLCDYERRDRQRLQHIDALQRQVAELKHKLHRNSSNSSLPPSANPPSARKLRTKQPTGRPSGGQIGHIGHGHKWLPVEQVDVVIPHRPGVCLHCQAPLPAEDQQLIRRHQVAELPQRPVQITEHQAYACRCPICGQDNRAAIPSSILASTLGERLSVVLCLLSASLHGSRRGAQWLLDEALGVPRAMATVLARERELSRALEGPYEQLCQQVQRAVVKNVDETGWKRAGRWLWTAATDQTVVFRLEHGRDGSALKTLLGAEPIGIISSDRFTVYQLLPVDQRQVCWAHLKRDFTGYSEHPGGRTRRMGLRGLEVCRQVFEHWRLFQEGQISRNALQRRMGPLRRAMEALLKKGLKCEAMEGRGFCRKVLELHKALWTFVRKEGVEPTNNLAERMLRPAVQWRKKSQGSASEGGCRYVERILSLVHTCRLRGQNVIDYLQKVLRHRRQGLDPPLPEAPSSSITELAA